VLVSNREIFSVLLVSTCFEQNCGKAITLLSRGWLFGFALFVRFREHGWSFHHIHSFFTFRATIVVFILHHSVNFSEILFIAFQVVDIFRFCHVLTHFTVPNFSIYLRSSHISCTGHLGTLLDSVRLDNVVVSFWLEFFSVIRNNLLLRNHS
jgi:hypothetical protein